MESFKNRKYEIESERQTVSERMLEKVCEGDCFLSHTTVAELKTIRCGQHLKAKDT